MGGAEEEAGVGLQDVLCYGNFTGVCFGFSLCICVLPSAEVGGTGFRGWKELDKQLCFPKAAVHPGNSSTGAAGMGF